MISCRRIALAALVLSSAALAQQGRAPDPHWGADIFPRDEHEWRGLLSFSRFTVYSSTSLGSDPTTGKFNEDVDESGGFNLLNIQHTHEIYFRDEDRLTYTWTLGLGYAADEPTQILQNDYLHEILGQNDVPTINTMSESAWSVGGAINYWFGEHSFLHRDDELFDESWRWSGVIGIGAVASSLYYEPEVHIGGALDFPRYNCRFTALHRLSTPFGGETYRDVADLSNLSQVSVYYSPNNFYTRSSLEWSDLYPHRWFSGLHTLIGRPEVGVHITHDSGLFEDVANNDISTWFISASFEWSTGIRVEIWNDILNGTDHGPTFGVLFGVDLLAFYDRYLGGK